MQTLGRCFRVPLKRGKPLGRIRQRLVFILHVRDEVGPNIVDRFHVITALLHAGVAVLPPETHEADASFDAQPSLFESLRSLGHARPGTYRVVDHDHRFTRIDLAFYQLARTVLLPLFANQKTTITTVL